MRDVLEQYLQPETEPRYQVLTCTLTNARRRDDSRGSVQYEVRFFDPESGNAWDQIVSGVSLGKERTQRVWEVIRSAKPSPVAATGHPSLPPYAYVPELDLLLQVFPHDHRLPALAPLLAGPVAELVPGILGDFGSGDWIVLAWNAEPVQYRVDMRAIVRLQVTADHALSGRQERRQFYAKVYRDANQVRQSERTQLQLHERLVDANECLSVARPVACSPELRTIVTQAMPGVSLAKIIRRGENVERSLRLTAQAIATFHHLEIEAPTRPVADDVARLHDAEAALQSRRPDLAPQISAIVEAVLNGLSDAPSSLIHGDLKPEHILIDGERVTLLDFDLLAISDPMVDIAHLVAFLGKSQERSRRSGGDNEIATQVFLDEYFRHVPQAWRARLPIYHALTSIHKATGLSRNAGPERMDLIADILREGQAFLDGNADDSTAPSFKRRITRSMQ